jgi:surface antigen
MELKPFTWRGTPRSPSLSAVLAALVMTAATSGAPNNAAAANLGSCASAGTVLRPGDYLSSGGSSPYTLEMQFDGNLVLYNAGRTALFDSRTWNNPGAYFTVQYDGNGVLYSAGGTALFDTKTWGNAGVRLCIQSDANVVLYSSSWSPLWATQTWLNASRGQTVSSNPAVGGQCTWGAQEMFHWYAGAYMATTGNAKDWPLAVRQRGWTVGTRPRMDSMIVFQPGVNGAGSNGHVAWITAVWPDRNSVQIKEMNFTSGAWNWDYRTIYPAINTGSNATTGQINLQYIYTNP